MIEILPQLSETCLAVHFSGKVTGQEFQQFIKAAFVGDQKWIEWFTRFIGLFTRTEEKHFPAGQLEAAFSWACA